MERKAKNPARTHQPASSGLAFSLVRTRAPRTTSTSGGGLPRPGGEFDVFFPWRHLPSGHSLRYRGPNLRLGGICLIIRETDGTSGGRCARQLPSRPSAAARLLWCRDCIGFSLADRSPRQLIGRRRLLPTNGTCHDAMTAAQARYPCAVDCSNNLSRLFVCFAEADYCVRTSTTSQRATGP